MNERGRANNFDALRLIAAATVIYSHSFIIANGNENAEPLIVASGRQSILGLAGVFVFFAISGFLVTQSWEETRSPWRYLAKRCLRIFPGLVLALVLSGFVLAPVVSTLKLGEYLSHAEPYRYVFWNTLLDLRQHELPGVMFVDNPVGLEVNGSLWTLRYEFEMYLMVLALGVTGLLRLPVLLALLALGLACIQFQQVPALDALGGWGWMLSFFVAGMVLYKLRGTRIFDGRIALLALIGLVATVRFGGFILMFSIFGCYVALYLALHPRLPRIPAARWGDLSYGLYIYGWPSEQAVIWALGGHATQMQVFLLALPLAALLAFVSWHVVEQPALRLKPRGARTLPAQPETAPAT
ncbi:MAG TPA: acyltransferase [Stellaceae bacterium]|nr:acyltransferase [Stellaceae bacterium]